MAEERSRVGYELHLLNVTILSTAEEPLPIVINQKKVNTSMENLLDYRPITLRNEKERVIFRIQAGICQAFREFLNREKFTEIHSPKIVAEGAEGGANIFKLLLPMDLPDLLGLLGLPDPVYPRVLEIPLAPAVLWCSNYRSFSLQQGSSCILQDLLQSPFRLLKM